MPVVEEQKKRTLRRPFLVSESLTSVIPTPFGPAELYCTDNHVSQLRLFLAPNESQHPEELDQPLGTQVEQALSAYFESGQRLPKFPLMPAGSEYCQTVWQRLVEIPFGQTLTYGELAKQLSSGPRAIAQACRRNPIPLLIPCHRVVAATGIGGYSGAVTGPRVEFKRWLLKHEAAVA